MVANLDSEYPSQLDTTNYLSRYDLGSLGKSTKTSSQTLKIYRVREVIEFENSGEILMKRTLSKEQRHNGVWKTGFLIENSNVQMWKYNTHSR